MSPFVGCASSAEEGTNGGESEREDRGSGGREMFRSSCQPDAHSLKAQHSGIA